MNTMIAIAVDVWYIVCELGKLCSDEKARQTESKMSLHTSRLYRQSKGAQFNHRISRPDSVIPPTCVRDWLSSLNFASGFVPSY